jgi:hypothetical protein
MGKGETVLTTLKHEGWAAVLPGSAEKKMWDAVCSAS